MTSFFERFQAILPHLGTILGFLLAFVLISRLMREKRRPSNTVAWLLVIVLVPYVGVPLYILFGGRKIAKLKARKSPVELALDPEGGEDGEGGGFSRVTAGNRVRFHETGVEAFEELERQIREAQTSIDLMTFILKSDAVGRRIMASLARKAGEGKRVRVLIDAIGSLGMKAFYLRDLEKAGGQIERFMPVLPLSSPHTANLRNHRKVAVFDGRRAILGGRNIGQDYMGPADTKRRWMDFGAYLEGPAVTPLNALFEADWAFARRKKGYEPQPVPKVEPLQDGPLSEIEIMASGPDTREDPLYERTLSAIHEADESVVIVTPYYIPDEVLQRSLMVKARSGKRVTLIVPRRSNHPVTDLARNHYLRELADAGAEVLLYLPRMLHAKLLVVDDRLAMTGSANMDLRSLFVNYEVAAFFHSGRDVAAFRRYVARLRREAITLADEEAKPLTLGREIAEDLSRLLAPLL